MGSQCCKGDASNSKNKPTSLSSTSSRLGTRGDQELIGERYAVSENNNTVHLSVQRVTHADAGQYTMVAKNMAGEARGSVMLQVDAYGDTGGADAPAFLRRLSDLAVKVGTRTRFLVEIRSSSDIKVTWLRSDRPVVEGERFKFIHEGNFFCVDVAPVTVEDGGRWTCLAENSSGRSSCSSHLNVLVPKAYKSPEFLEELRAILTEGGTVSLECKVVGVPTPVLRWYKDGKEIKAGDVFALTANPEDPTSLGTYTCEAVNCMGKTYSSSRVHVVGKGSREGSLKPADSLAPAGPPPIFTQELGDKKVKIGEPLTLACHVGVPPWPKSIAWYNKDGRVDESEKYHVMEDGLGGYIIETLSAETADEGEWKCVATNSDGSMGFSKAIVTMIYPKNYRKPRFLESLKAILTDEGLVSFECKVVGFPTPQLRWFKDGQELKPGDVYQLTGTNSLGSYSCIAKNLMGEATSSAELTVEDIQSQLSEEERLQLFSTNQPPKFLHGLKSCEAKINEHFRLTVQVSISPEPKISWYRDDEQLEDSDRYQATRENLGVCHMDVKRVEIIDQAEWKCVATNDFGHSVTSCFMKLIIPKHFKKPRFLECLRAILSEEGAVNLECKVIGVPQPVLKWYKDGEELKPGDIHRIISGEDGRCCLGTYTCEASNCMGAVSSSASLLGFEERMLVKPQEHVSLEQSAANMGSAGHMLARNTSLSTIHEERTSQMYDPVTEKSLTIDERAEVSFSFDGKEVSVSLYETPDLTEEEALQVLEMYADELSEHVSEHNVVELPPMRFTKESQNTGNLLMEAVVIDVTPEFFASAADDDLRTDADIEDLSISEAAQQPGLPHDQEDDGIFDELDEEFLDRALESSTPFHDAPRRPPRKKSSSRADSEAISDNSYHSVSAGASKGKTPSEHFTDANAQSPDNDSRGKTFESARGSSGEKMVVDAADASSKRKTQDDDDLSDGKKKKISEPKSDHGTQTGVPKRVMRSVESGQGESFENIALARFQADNDALKMDLTLRQDSEKIVEETVQAMQETVASEVTQAEERLAVKAITPEEELTPKISRKKIKTSQSKEENVVEEIPPVVLRRKKKAGSGEVVIDSMKLEKTGDALFFLQSQEDICKSGDKDDSYSEEGDGLKTRLAIQSEEDDREEQRLLRRSSSLEINKSDVNLQATIQSEIENITKTMTDREKRLSGLDYELPRLQSPELLDPISYPDPASADKGEPSLLDNLTQSLLNIQKGLSSVENKVITELDPKFAQSSLSVLESLSQPISDIQKGLALAEENSSSEELTPGKAGLAILENLAQPIKDFQRGLATIEQQTFESRVADTQLESTQYSILENVARPVEEFNRSVELIQQLAMLETTTGDESLADVSNLPSATTPAKEIQKALAKIGLRQPDDVDESLADTPSLRSYATPPQDNQNWEHVYENVARSYTKSEDASLAEVPSIGGYVSPVDELQMALANINQGLLPRRGSSPSIRSYATPPQEIHKPLVQIGDKVLYEAEPLIQMTNVPILQTVVYPVQDLQRTFAALEQQADEEARGDEPIYMRASVSILESFSQPIEELRRGVILIEQKVLGGTSDDNIGALIIESINQPMEELERAIAVIEQQNILESSDEEVAEMTKFTILKQLAAPIQNLVHGLAKVQKEYILEGTENLESKIPMLENIEQSIKEVQQGIARMSQVNVYQGKPLEASEARGIELLASLNQPLTELQRGIVQIERNIVLEKEVSSLKTRLSSYERINVPLQQLQTGLTQIEQFVVEVSSEMTKSTTSLEILAEPLHELKKNIAMIQQQATYSSEEINIAMLANLTRPLQVLQKGILNVASQNAELTSHKSSVEVVQSMTQSVDDLKQEMARIEYRAIASPPQASQKATLSMLGTLSEPLQELHRGLIQAEQVLCETPQEELKELDLTSWETLTKPLHELREGLSQIEKIVFEDVTPIATSSASSLELLSPMIHELQKGIISIQQHAVVSSESQQAGFSLMDSIASPLLELQRSLSTIIEEPHLETETAEIEVQKSNKSILNTMTATVQKLRQEISQIDESPVDVTSTQSKLTVMKVLSEPLYALHAGLSCYEQQILVSSKVLSPEQDSLKALECVSKPLEELTKQLIGVETSLAQPRFDEEVKNMSIESLEMLIPPIQKVHRGIEIFKQQAELESAGQLSELSITKTLARPLEELSKTLATIESVIVTEKEMKQMVRNPIEYVTQTIQQASTPAAIYEIIQENPEFGILENLAHPLEKLGISWSVLEENSSETDNEQKKKVSLLALGTPIDDVQRSISLVRERILFTSGEDSELMRVLETISHPIDLLQASVSHIQETVPPEQLETMSTEKTVSEEVMDFGTALIQELQKAIAITENRTAQIYQKVSEIASLNLVESLNEPLKKLQDKMNLVEKENLLAVGIEQLSDEKVSLLQHLVEPIEKIQQGIAVIEKKRAVDGEKATVFKAEILESLSQPLKDLQHGLELIEEQVHQETEEAHLPEASGFSILQILAQPIVDIKRNIAQIEQQVILEAQEEEMSEKSRISALQALAKSATASERGLPQVEQQVLLEARGSDISEKTAISKLQSQAQEMQEKQRGIAQVEQQVALEAREEDMSEKSSASLLKTLAQPIEELQRGLAQVEQQVALEAREEDMSEKSSASLLKTLAQPIEELQRGLAQVEQQVALEAREEDMSEKSSASLLKTLAQPIEELQRGLAQVEQQVALEAREEDMSEKSTLSMLQTLAQPMQELQRSLAQVEQQFAFDAREENILSDEGRSSIFGARADVAETSLREVASKHQQVVLDANAEEMSEKTDVDELKTRAHKQVKSPRETVCVQEQMLMEPGAQELSHGSSISDLKTWALPVQEVLKQLAEIQQQFAVEFSTEMSDREDPSGLKTLAQPIQDLHQALEQIGEQIVMEGDTELSQRENLSYLATLAKPIQEIQSGIAFITEQHALEAGAEAMSEKVDISLLKTLAEPLKELERQIVLIEEQELWEGVESAAISINEDTIVSDLPTLASNASMNVVQVEEQLVFEPEARSLSDFTDVSELQLKPARRSQRDVAVVEQAELFEGQVASLAEFRKGTLEIARPVQEVLKQLAEVQQQFAVEFSTALSDRDDPSGLKTLAQPIQDLHQALVQIGEQIIMEGDIELSQKENLSYLTTLAKPIQDIQTGIALITEQHTLEAGAVSMSDKVDISVLKTLAVPLKELERQIVLIEEQELLEGVESAAVSINEDTIVSDLPTLASNSSRNVVQVEEQLVFEPEARSLSDFTDVSEKQPTSAKSSQRQVAVVEQAEVLECQASAVATSASVEIEEQATQEILVETATAGEVSEVRITADTVARQASEDRENERLRIEQAESVRIAEEARKKALEIEEEEHARKVLEDTRAREKKEKEEKDRLKKEADDAERKKKDLDEKARKKKEREVAERLRLEEDERIRLQDEEATRIELEMAERIRKQDEEAERLRLEEIEKERQNELELERIQIEREEKEREQREEKERFEIEIEREREEAELERREQEAREKLQKIQAEMLALEQEEAEKKKLEEEDEIERKIQLEKKERKERRKAEEKKKEEEAAAAKRQEEEEIRIQKEQDEEQKRKAEEEVRLRKAKEHEELQIKEAEERKKIKEEEEKEEQSQLVKKQEDLKRKEEELVRLQQEEKEQKEKEEDEQLKKHNAEQEQERKAKAEAEERKRQEDEQIRKKNEDDERKLKEEEEETKQKKQEELRLSEEEQNKKLREQEEEKRKEGEQLKIQKEREAVKQMEEKQKQVQEEKERLKKEIKEKELKQKEEDEQKKNDEERLRIKREQEELKLKEEEEELRLQKEQEKVEQEKKEEQKRQKENEERKLKEEENEKERVRKEKDELEKKRKVMEQEELKIKEAEQEKKMEEEKEQKRKEEAEQARKLEEAIELEKKQKEQKKEEQKKKQAEEKELKRKEEEKEAERVKDKELKKKEEELKLENERKKVEEEEMKKNKEEEERKQKVKEESERKQKEEEQIRIEKENDELQQRKFEQEKKQEAEKVQKEQEEINLQKQKDLEELKKKEEEQIKIRKEEEEEEIKQKELKKAKKQEAERVKKEREQEELKKTKEIEELKKKADEKLKIEKEEEETKQKELEIAKKKEDDKVKKQKEEEELKKMKKQEDLKKEEELKQKKLEAEKQREAEKLKKKQEEELNKQKELDELKKKEDEEKIRIEKEEEELKLKELEQAENQKAEKLKEKQKQEEELKKQKQLEELKMKEDEEKRRIMKEQEELKLKEQEQVKKQKELDEIKQKEEEQIKIKKEQEELAKRELEQAEKLKKEVKLKKDAEELVRKQKELDELKQREEDQKKKQLEETELKQKELETIKRKKVEEEAKNKEEAERKKLQEEEEVKKNEAEQKKKQKDIEKLKKKEEEEKKKQKEEEQQRQKEDEQKKKSKEKEELQQKELEQRKEKELEEQRKRELERKKLEEEHAKAIQVQKETIETVSLTDQKKTSPKDRKNKITSGKEVESAAHSDSSSPKTDEPPAVEQPTQRRRRVSTETSDDVSSEQSEPRRRRRPSTTSASESDTLTAKDATDQDATRRRRVRGEVESTTQDVEDNATVRRRRQRDTQSEVQETNRLQKAKSFDHRPWADDTYEKSDTFTESTLTPWIRPRSRADDSSRNSSEDFSIDTTSSRRSRATEGNETGNRDAQKKPSFCTRLTDRTAAQGSRIKLMCSVLGSPEPKVEWLRDGLPLQLRQGDSSKYRQRLEDGLAHLEVLNASTSDSGEFTCVARNAHGEASTTATLKVFSGFEPAPFPPTFTRGIKDVYHFADDELVLECRVRSQPPPRVTWLKDNVPLRPSSRYQQTELADGVCRLVINGPEGSADSGQYTCRAENAVWTDQISHTVIFEGRENHMASRRMERSGNQRAARDGRRPHFSSVLTDHLVPSGGTIALQVEIRGGARPDVTWLRGTEPLAPTSSRVRTFEESGVYTLMLADARDTEAGIYTCRAANAYGYVDTSAAVEVVRPGSVRGGRPAMFMSRPDQDMSVTLGEDITISFRVQGDPKPRVIWMKGTRDITNSQRSLKETLDDYVRLTLKRALPSDAGTYCIMAKNVYGCDRSFVTVQIRQRARSLTPSISHYPQDTFTILRDVRDDMERSKLRDVPAAVGGEPVVVESGKNWLTLAWPKGESRGGIPVLAYKVEAWQLGQDGGARWQEMGISPINSFDAFNLKAGTEYQFRITPRNRYGWGESVTTRSPITIGRTVELPEFVQILPGQLKALSGSNIRLECQVRGDPTPEVRWYRDSTLLDPTNPRLSSDFNGSQCRLSIEELTDEDSGRYMCEATNKKGRVSTFARLLVVSDPKIWIADNNLKRGIQEDEQGSSTTDFPPQFTMRLRDRRVQMTYPVRLTCQVVGRPAPKITWCKDGQEVTQDDQHSFSNEDHFHTLELSHTGLEHSGCYSVTASNNHGAVSCKCHLVVDKGIRAYVAPDFLGELEAEVTIREGGELRLAAQVEAYPTVGVMWHRDGVRLRPSRRAVMTLDHDGGVELAIGGATLRDAGVYSCTATNEVGRAETSSKVRVVATTTKTPVKPPQVLGPELPYSAAPLWVTKPRSTDAVEGDTVIIQCEVVGDPKPDVWWLRDFLKPDYYRDAPHFRRLGEGPQYRLEIPRAKLDFTGAYSVIARNTHGEAKAVISLQIYAKGQGKETMEHSSVKHGAVQTLPQVKRELKDLRCCDGDAVTLECCVDATPTPDVRWEKEGRLVPLGGDFQADFDGETARLSIHQVYPEDEGEYTCVVYNELGKASTSACLVVDVPEEKETLLSQHLSRPPGLLSTTSTPMSTPRNTPRTTPSRSKSPSMPRQRERDTTPSSYGAGRTRRLKVTSPKFYAVPHNRVAEEGETIRFQCAIAGHPTPWVTWDKDGLLVTPNARLTITEKDDLRVLELTEVTVEDAGLYRITLENEVGRIEASARLEVIGHNGARARGSIRAWSASPRTSPTFGRRLIGSAARAGNRLALDCEIRGTPSPVPSWYRNGELVVMTSRVTPTWDGKVARLEVFPVDADDAGVYCCLAENEAGVSQCTARVLVLDENDPSQEDRLPPVFLQELQENITVEEGHVVELQAQLCGAAPIEVVWSRDNVEIPDCADFRYVTHDDGRIALRLADMFPEDAGVYRCEAFNSFGDALTWGRLTIRDEESAESLQQQPQFVKKPASVLVSLGRQASFCARLASTQGITLSWTVDGRSVDSDPRYQVENDGDVSILHIAAVDATDAGVVMCTAKSSTSSSSTYAELTVMKDDDLCRSCADHVTRSRSMSPVRAERTVSRGRRRDAEEQEMPATLLRGPADTTVLRGDQVVLKAAFAGCPTPQVRWLRAGRELVSDGRLHIVTDETESRLTLDSITADEGGKYVVSVENTFGADCHFASVAVEGPPDPPGSPPTASPADDASCVVAWSSAPYDGGCIVTGYSLEMRREEENDWTLVSDECHSFSHMVRGLSPGEGYVFRVRAINVHGPSEPSVESRVVKMSPPDQEEELFSPAFAPRVVEVESGSDFKQRFEILEELGKGRFGVVHKVSDRQTNQKLAAKFIRCIKSKDREKVQEEIDIMNCLRHPKLLQLAAAFENPREIVMVMELISGGELFERVVADDFTLTERDCILFMRQIVEGVEYMHKNAVVHLDLKPENIMCYTRTSHQIKLIDFGLAKKLDPAKPVRVLFGTPEFIPPEIINYENIGLESDMWSVGVICYVLLSGLSPFMGDSDADTFANITRADFDFDDEAFDAISQESKDFISSLLIEKKEKRLTASECLQHKWLAQHDESMSNVALCTDKLKKFIIRRKWQKTGNAIRALGRMATLSAASRRNSAASTTSTSPRPSLCGFSRMSSLNEEDIGLALTCNNRVFPPTNECSKDSNMITMQDSYKENGFHSAGIVESALSKSNRARMCSERSDSGISDCSSSSNPLPHSNFQCSNSTPLLNKKFSISEGVEYDISEESKGDELGVSLNGKTKTPSSVHTAKSNYSKTDSLKQQSSIDSGYGDGVSKRVAQLQVSLKDPMKPATTTTTSTSTKPTLASTQKKVVQSNDQSANYKKAMAFWKP